jgi:hypothetical protein
MKFFERNRTLVYITYFLLGWLISANVAKGPFLLIIFLVVLLPVFYLFYRELTWSSVKEYYEKTDFRDEVSAAVEIFFKICIFFAIYIYIIYG